MLRIIGFIVLFVLLIRFPVNFFADILIAEHMSLSYKVISNYILVFFFGWIYWLIYFKLLFPKK